MKKLSRALKILILILGSCTLVNLKPALAKQVFFSCKQQSFCHSEAVNFLERNLKYHTHIYSDTESSNVGSYSNINFEETAKKKIPYLYIFVHGLYMDANFFNRLAHHSPRNIIRYILLTLPGHGGDHRNANLTTYVDWKLQLHHMVLAAREISDNVILVGHSTGAVLSLVEAMDYPDLIDGLWLIEPAIKVNPWLQGFSCTGKNIVTDPAPFLKKLARLSGNEWSIKKMPLRFGCEVKNVWYDFLNRKNLIPSNFRSETQLDEFYESSRKGIKFLKTPTILEYNPKDMVIDTKILGIFTSVDAPIIIEHSNDNFHGVSALTSDIERFGKNFIFLLNFTRNLTSEHNAKELFSYLIDRTISTARVLRFFPERASEVERTINLLGSNRQILPMFSNSCRAKVKETMEMVKLYQTHSSDFINTMNEGPVADTLEETCLEHTTKQ